MDKKIHGYYQWSNNCGYGVILSDCGEQVKLVIEDSETDWLDIEFIMDKDTGEFEPTIDHTGYNVPLSEVMRAY